MALIQYIFSRDLDVYTEKRGTDVTQSPGKKKEVAEILPRLVFLHASRGQIIKRRMPQPIIHKITNKRVLSPSDERAPYDVSNSSNSRLKPRLGQEKEQGFTTSTMQSATEEKILV